MCLPFLMASIDPPNEKCKNMVSKLKILFYIQLVMAIVKCFFLFSSSSSGDAYLDMFSCCAIYMAYSQISHMGCVMHIFLSLYSFICEFVVVGTLIQDGIAFFTNSSSNNIYMVVVLFSVIFYIVAIYYVFQAYKEFKACSIEGLINNAGGGGYFGQEDEQDYYPQQQPFRSQPQPRPQAQPTSSQSQPQPARNAANQNVQMSNSSNNNPNANAANRNAGGFNAFTGSGVKIGGS